MMLPTDELERTLQDYCMDLLKQVKLEKISLNPISDYLNGVFYFLKVNRVKYDEELITILFSDKKKLGGYDAITKLRLYFETDYIIWKGITKKCSLVVATIYKCCQKIGQIQVHAH